MGLDWHFSAVAASDAYEYGRDKAAVLVAPQIGYQAKRLQAAMPEVPVLAIPTATFASYDAAGCLEWLREELASRKKTAEERAIEHVSGDLVNDTRILALRTRRCRRPGRRAWLWRRVQRPDHAGGILTRMLDIGLHVRMSTMAASRGLRLRSWRTARP